MRKEKKEINNAIISMPSDLVPRSESADVPGIVTTASASSLRIYRGSSNSIFPLVHLRS